MTNAEFSIAPAELAERFASETAHLSEADRLLAWPPVLQDMSLSIHDLDGTGFDGEIRPNTLTEKAIATLMCDLDTPQPHFLIHNIVEVGPERGVDGFRVDTDDPVLIELAHLNGADFLIDLEVGDLSLDAEAKNFGRIAAIRAIETPNPNFSQLYATGYIRGRVTRAEESAEVGGHVGMADIELTSGQIVHFTNVSPAAPYRYEPLKYSWYKGVPVEEAVPETGDIVSGQAVEYNPFNHSIQMPTVSLLYRARYE